MCDLKGRVAIVTGTSRKRGLGRAIALRLADEGADLLVTDKHIPPENVPPWDKAKNWNGLDSLVAEIEARGRRALAVTADITASSEINNVVKQAIEKFGKIDILVNNAAVTASETGFFSVVDMPEETWGNTMAINLLGTFLMCQAVARHMIERSRGGKIINFASSAAKRPAAKSAAYNASKAGVISLTQTLALELGEHQINVNVICNGQTVTWGPKGKELYEATQQGLSEDEAVAKVYAGMIMGPLGRPATVQDVADVVAYLASDHSAFITGQAINVDGGRIMER